jgi:hypothetical protein
VKEKRAMQKAGTVSRAVAITLLASLCLPIAGKADIAIRQAAGTDSSHSLAYNPQSQEYLVVWIAGNIYAQGPVMAQRVSETGTLVGSPITITSFAFGKTSVAYNPAHNQFLVAYTTGILPDKTINGQLVDANGTLVGGSATLMGMASHPRLMYNSIAGTYLLLGLKTDLFSRKIGANGQPLATEVNVTNDASVDYSKFAAAYAPVTSAATPTGRYLVAKYPVSLMMLDSDGQPVNTLYNPQQGWYEASIPFKTGPNTGGEYDVDIAYGDTSGYSMWGKAFLVVWSDRNNYWNSQEWTGIWGGYVDPGKTEYLTTDAVVDNAFPISCIYAHWAYSAYASTWKPVVAFNSVARKFQIAWRETPSSDPSNDATVPHIRANAGFFSVPPSSNIVLSDITGTEEPATPAIAASTTSGSALVVWADSRNSATTGRDLYGALYDISGPAALPLIVTHTNDSGPGSLRQAILDANLRAGADSITFAIPLSDGGYQASMGVWKIQPLSPLPELLNDATLVNGISQTLFAGDTNPLGPEVEIDGSLAGYPADGFRIRSYWSGIWGLAINRFNGNGVLIEGPNAGGNLIIRSYIGVTPDGKNKAPNLGAGVLIRQAALNFVGFFDTLSANVIGGNSGMAGIWLAGAESRFNAIMVNSIGTDLLRAADLGNAGDGICISDSARDNAVTGYAFPSHVVVRNNAFAGMRVDGAASVRNLLAAGSVTGNSGPGIELSAGGNDQKAAPVITTADATGIAGTAAPRNMVFLYNDSDDEGEEYFATVYADASGHFTWSGTPKGPHITAVAVDTAQGPTLNNTSAFSAPASLIPTGCALTDEIPGAFGLLQNSPNPFNPTTRIRIQVSGTSHVRLVVYDLLGREVAVLVDEWKAPGRYTARWDGSGTASGVYFCRMTAGDFVDCIRMMLLK